MSKTVPRIVSQGSIALLTLFLVRNCTHAEWHLVLLCLLVSDLVMIPMFLMAAKRAASSASSSADGTVAADLELSAKRSKTSDNGKIATTTALVSPKLCAESSNPLPYSELCTLFSAVEATKKRLEIQSLVRTFFLDVLFRHQSETVKSENEAKLVADGLRQRKRFVSEDRMAFACDELRMCVYLCVNRLCPDYVGLELGIGESLLLKAIAEATGNTLAKLRTQLRTSGDLGLVAEKCRGAQKTISGFTVRQLTIPRVFELLTEIASIKGNDSQRLKISKITSALVACRSGAEARFFVRSLEGKLRIGLAERTIIVALAQAIALFESGMSQEKCAKTIDEDLFKVSEDAVKAAYSEVPSYDVLIPALLKHGLKDLPNQVFVTPGVPLKPMLAHPTRAVSEVLDRFDNKMFTCEYKYDGERAQVHRLQDGKVLVFSRNSENMSAKYPDLVALVSRLAAEGKFPETFILDCEAVAWDRAKQQILPFQVLSTRKRKDVEESEITVQVCIFAFDLLFADGVSLIRRPLGERRKILREKFAEEKGYFMLATSMDATSVDEIQGFLDEAVSNTCEGLMVKSLDETSSGYEPSKRSRKWLKLKKDYILGASGGVGDSLDLVVIGADHGKGKRVGMYGNFLLACYDPDSDCYQTVCKIGTGFSEEQLAELTKTLEPLVISAPKPYYNYGGADPDVWFDASLVWEVRAADLSLSPVYTAGNGIVNASGSSAGRGVSLRFPRYIRTRDDRTPETATTSRQVASMYSNQQSVSATVANADGDESDYYG